MNSLSVPLSERGAADQAAFVEIKASEQEAVNGGTCKLTTATEYVNQIMSHVSPYPSYQDGVCPCGNGIGSGNQGPQPKS